MGKLRKLISQDKEREIAYKLLSWAAQTHFWENEFNLLPIKIDSGSEKQRHTLKRHLSSPLSHAQLHTFSPDSSTPLSQVAQRGWRVEGAAVSLYRPFLHCAR